MDRAGSSPPAVAVVGGGLSGTLVTAQLLRRSRTPLEVFLFEKDARFGRGVAFGTTHASHLLNVPAAKMSALPDDPGHFLRWLRAPGPEGAPARWAEAGPDDFAPRSLYGAYAAAVLEESERLAGPGVALRAATAEVAAVHPGSAGVTLLLADGRTISASRAVLAIGNLPPSDPAGPGLESLDAARYVRDPWAPGALQALPSQGPVLLLGTGLTMVDAVLALHGQGHPGPFRAISRRGLLPRAHGVPPATPISPRLDNGIPGIRVLVRRLREALEEGEGARDWRSAVDGLRPVTQRLWQGLSDTDRRRFLRHARPYWDVARHRIAPGVAAVMEELRRSGKLTVRAARLERVEALPRGIRATISPRGTGLREELAAEAVINCTGPTENHAAARIPILRDLARNGAIRPGPCGIGLDTSIDGALIGADGFPSPVLFTLGPPRRGNLWETTAVPEIRAQAEELAAAILRGL